MNYGEVRADRQGAMSAGNAASQGFGFGIGCFLAGFVVLTVGGLILFAVISIGVGGGGADLSELRTQCGQGDGGACDQLYLQAPFGSEDEAFGLSCGSRTIPFARAFGASCTELIAPEPCIGILCDDDP